MGDNEYNLSDLYGHKNEIIEELKKAEYNDLEDMVFRMELTNSEIAEILDTKYNATSPTGYILPPSIDETNDNNLML